jgi:hypothetical protein
MAIYSDLGGSSAPVDPGLTEAEALLEAKKVSGYLGLLSPYYFGGVGTTTTITPSQANQWVDVNLEVDTNGLFDYRPADMVAADANGFEGTGVAASEATVMTLEGNLDFDQTSSYFDVDISSSVTGYSVRFLKSFSGAAQGEWRVMIFLEGSNVGEEYIQFDASGPASGEPTTITDSIITVDVSGVSTISGANSVSLTGDNQTAGDPFLFTLCGLTQQSFGKMRVTALYNPDIDEGQLDVRLLFTPNSSGQFGQFSIAEQAATMSQGADVEYFIEPTITFFVGDSIEEIGTVEASDAGRVQLQIRSSVEGEFTLRGLTLYVHS